MAKRVQRGRHRGRYTPRARADETVDEVYTVPDMQKLMKVIGRGSLDGVPLDEDTRRTAAVIFCKLHGFVDPTAEDLDFLMGRMAELTQELDSGLTAEEIIAQIIETDGRFRGSV